MSHTASVPRARRVQNRRDWHSVQKVKTRPDQSFTLYIVLLVDRCIDCKANSSECDNSAPAHVLQSLGRFGTNRDSNIDFRVIACSEMDVVFQLKLDLITIFQVLWQFHIA